MHTANVLSHSFMRKKKRKCDVSLGFECVIQHSNGKQWLMIIRHLQPRTISATQYYFALY